MLGDTAVAVQSRRRALPHLIGLQIRLPLTGRLIPIIADDYVDPPSAPAASRSPRRTTSTTTKSASATPAADQHLHADAASTTTRPEAYRGLDRFEARKRVVGELEALGLLEKIEPHKLMVPRGDRSHAVIEPWLTDQWYVKTAPLAGPPSRAVETGKHPFVPENWENLFRLDAQHPGLVHQPAAVVGPPHPGLVRRTGKVYVGRSEAEVRAKHPTRPSVTLRQDEDVLDTWFSSALWPFSTLGWPEHPRR
jgi:valyl-tRNA synthetase